jgi:hypothetical protein
LNIDFANIWAYLRVCFSKVGDWRTFTMSETIASRDSTMAQDYYASLDEEGSLVEKFKDIDDKTQFHTAIRRLQDPLTQNFVLDFGNEDAWCASDLNTDELKLLLRKPVCWLKAEKI